jgi:NADH-quinone oxidoreductase subunit E
MSVRRLAEQAVQPASFAFNRAKAGEAKTWIKKYPRGRQQSAVIPLLMLAQEQEGWVTKPAIEHIADMLEMPYIRVLEVATFYTQFQLKPVGTRAHVQVCGTTPCMLRGSEDLMDVCRSKIHHDQFHTNAAGTLSWEEVECLGACVNAPMVMIFKDTYEDLTPERLAEIIDEFETGKGAQVPTGPQNGRTFAAPITGLTSLGDERAVLKSTRDKETKASARAAKTPTEQVPPTQAARPKTDAPETNPAIKSPSKVKVSANDEKTGGVAPKGNKVAADASEPAVEGEARPRKARTISDADTPSATMAPSQTARSVPAKPSGRTTATSEPVNPSMARAETAKGLGKPADASAPAAPSAVAAQQDRNRPAGIARPETPDDLQLISGVGPKIEGILHSLGIYTYTQVASWKKAERDWVDGYLRFHGRIEREDWVKQAKALAKGGVAEYVRVFGKKPR